MVGVCYSLQIPFWKICHFEAGKKVSESRKAKFKGYAHYDKYGCSFGKSMRNIKGDLIHYDNGGHIQGFSKMNSCAVTSHYDRNGVNVGHSVSVLNILFLHLH